MDKQPLVLLPEQFQSVSVAHLDFPEPLIGSLFQDVDQALLHQIAQIGLLQPLPVLEISRDRFHLLAGYAYLPVLRELGVQHIVCQVITASPCLSRYALQINHGLSTVPTSPILQALLLQSATEAMTADAALALLPLLGYKPQQHKLGELVKLLDLSSSAVVALHQGILSPKNGKLLARIGREDQEFLMQLLTSFRPGGSKQQKLIELLIELSLGRNQPMAALVRPWMDGRSQDDPANLPQQLQGLLRYLHEQSFPRLTEAQRQFQQLSQTLDLPDNVQLVPCTSFEDEHVELHILCEGFPALQQLWTTLSPLLKECSHPGKYRVG